MKANDLFDFTTANLQDIEIKNTLNQQIQLTWGHYLPPLSTRRVSDFYMTLEQFQEVFKTSSLPGYIRAGSVILKAICATVVTQADIEAGISAALEKVGDVQSSAFTGENVNPPVVSENPVTETGEKIIGTLVEENLKDTNPFGYDTNESIVGDNTTPPGKNTIKATNKASAQKK